MRGRLVNHSAQQVPALAAKSALDLELGSRSRSLQIATSQISNIVYFDNTSCVGIDSSF